MNKIRVIAHREYNATVRTKAFIVSLVLMPIMMGGGIVLPQLLEGRTDVADKRIAVIDHTGAILPRLIDAANARNEHEIKDTKTGRQTAPKFLLEPVADAADVEAVKVELSQRVRDRKLAGFLEIPASVLSDSRAKTAADDATPEHEKPSPVASTDPGLAAAQKDAAPPDPARVAAGAISTEVSFYSDNAAQFDLTRWLTNSVNQAAREVRLSRSGLDEAVVSAATAYVPLSTLSLYEKTASGTVKQAQKSSRELAFFLPAGIMMLMFMAVMVAAQPMLQSVLEEKQLRIAEVLLGSATPFQIMMGKLVGNVGVSVTIMAVYMLGGFGMLVYHDKLDLLPPDLALWFLAFQVLAVLLFGSVFISIGAACTELKEAQNLITPVMLILVLPLMVWFQIVREPMSNFATLLSLFPPATPLIMVMRMSAVKSLPVWQPLLGLGLTLATTIGFVWAAGRVFRIGILSQGKAPKIRELAGWIIRG